MSFRPAALSGALLLSAVVLAGCQSGLSGQSKRQMNAYLAADNYKGAEAFLERAKNSDYGRKNMVLFYLDKAAVQHHAGEYKESDRSFDIAERRMDELYTKSITQAGGMLLLNDTTVDYAGEPFERTLLNVFRALNYVMLGEPDEALVESRKVERFLTELNDRLGGRKGVYSDDAFARYLDALLYADEGKLDDARISLAASKKAYEDYAANYGTPAPVFAFPQDQVPRGEIVFIHYNGVAPRKVSKTFQVAWNEATAMVRQSDSEDGASAAKNALAAGFLGSAITVAYPAMVQDPYAIATSEVWVDSRPAGSSLLMEDVTAIATKSLEERMAFIKARAVARAAIKFILAKTASDAAAKACDRAGGGGFAIQLCKMGSRALASGVAAATEYADTRGWASLPAQIRMARVKLPPGTHDVEIVFRNAAGAVVSTRDFKGVRVELRKRTYLAARTAL